jgi:hypothetical protein
MAYNSSAADLDLMQFRLDNMGGIFPSLVPSSVLYIKLLENGTDLSIGVTKNLIDFR